MESQGWHEQTEQAIRTIHSIAISNMNFLGFGAQCVEVTGEP